MTEKAEKALKVSGAWKRLLLEKDGGISADGQVVLKDLMRISQMFGRQYEIGNPERTLELAVKRQFVIHILTALDLDEAQVRKAMELQRHDD